MIIDMPTNEDLENKVLSALINDKDAIHIISSFLQPSSFYNIKNRLIYSTARDLYNSSKIPDMSLVAAELTDKVDLIYISNIAGDYCSLDVLPDYCKVLKELEMRRDMLAGISRMQKAADLDNDIFDLTAEVSSYIDKVGAAPKETIITTTALFKNTFKAIEDASTNPGGFSLATEYAAAKQKISQTLGTPSSVGQLAVNNSPFYNWLKDNSLDKGIL